MKNSGIEWIGEIPDDWKLINIGSLFLCRNEKVNDTDYPPLSVSKGGIVPQIETVAKSDANDNRKMVLKNDFVINSRSDRKQSCGLSSLNGSVSLINTVLYVIDDKIILPQFTDYLLKNYGFAEEFYRWGHGIVADLWTTRWQEMKSIVLPLPTIEKQKRIIETLKEKLTATDKLIANQQGQIEKLKEYKQATITQAVTKGLNPSAPMKDSGVEWIGNIPEGWTIIKFKYLLDITSGDALTNERLLDSGEYPVYGGGNLIGYSPNYNFENGIIIGRVGARCGCVMLIDDKVWATDNALIVESKINKKYLFYLLVNANLNALNTSNAQPLITSSKIKNIMTLFTKNDVEQQQIAEYLDKKCSEIDKLISIKQAKIEKLNEYKKSLIYEYVTGKKEVV